MKFPFLTPFLLLGLAACATENIASSAYPDRQKFTFTSETADTRNTYLCAPKGSDSKTRSNAKAAHNYFEKKTKGYAENFAEDLIEDRLSSFEATARLNKTSEALAEELNQKYQCLLVKVVDS